MDILLILSFIIDGTSKIVNLLLLPDRVRRKDLQICDFKEALASPLRPPERRGAPDTLGGGPFHRFPLQRAARILAGPATPPRCILP